MRQATSARSFIATDLVRSTWSAAIQHGAPVSALLVRRPAVGAGPPDAALSAETVFQHASTRTLSARIQFPRSISQPQSRCGRLCYRLLHARTVRFRALAVVNQHGAVALHLEHVIGDRFADPVSRALVEVHFDPHDASYWTNAATRLTPCTKLLCSSSGSPNSTVVSRVSNSPNRFRSSVLAS